MAMKRRALISAIVIFFAALFTFLATMIFSEEPDILDCIGDEYCPYLDSLIPLPGVRVRT